MFTLTLVVKSYNSKFKTAVFVHVVLQSVGHYCTCHSRIFLLFPFSAENQQSFQLRMFCMFFSVFYVRCSVCSVSAVVFDAQFFPTLQYHRTCQHCKQPFSSEYACIQIRLAVREHIKQYYLVSVTHCASGVPPVWVWCSSSVVVVFLECGCGVPPVWLWCSSSVVVVFLECGCGVPPVWLWCSSSVVVVYLQCGCGVPRVWLWCSSSVAVVFLQCGCGVPPVWLWCTSSVVVVFLQCGCGVPPVWLWCSSSVVVVFLWQ